METQKMTIADVKRRISYIEERLAELGAELDGIKRLGIVSPKRFFIDQSIAVLDGHLATAKAELVELSGREAE